MTYHPNGAVNRFDYGDMGFFQQTLTAKQLPLNLLHDRDGAVLNLTYGYDANNRITSIEDLKTTTRDPDLHL